MKRSRGVTLIELMVTLAVAAILLTVAAPDWRRMVAQHQLRAVVSDLYHDIALARSQAIARNTRVMLVPVEEASWDAGWTVMVDHDGDRRPGAGDELLSVHQAVPPGIRISSVFTAQHAPFYIAFNGTGRGCSDTSSVAARWGSLSISGEGQVRRIRISMLGRARVCDPAREPATCGAAE